MSTHNSTSPPPDTVESLTEKYVQLLLSQLQVSTPEDARARIYGVLQGGTYPMPHEELADLLYLLRKERHDNTAKDSKSSKSEGSSRNSINRFSIIHYGYSAVLPTCQKTQSHPSQRKLSKLNTHLDKAIELLAADDIQLLLGSPNLDDQKETIGHLCAAVCDLRDRVLNAQAKEGRGNKPNIDELTAFVMRVARCYQEITGKAFTFDSHKDSNTGQPEPASEGGRFVAAAVQYLNELSKIHGLLEPYSKSNIATASKRVRTQLKSTDK